MSFGSRERIATHASRSELGSLVSAFDAANGKVGKGDDIVDTHPARESGLAYRPCIITVGVQRGVLTDDGILSQDEPSS